MKLNEYMQKTTGTGVLSTVDRFGVVNSAIYSRPHYLSKGIVAFIMRERRTFSNLQDTDSASFLFKEEGSDYSGVRLALRKIGEGKDQKQINAMYRRCLTDEEDAARGPKHLVYFQVEQILPLIGDTKPNVTM